MDASRHKQPERTVRRSSFVSKRDADVDVVVHPSIHRDDARSRDSIRTDRQSESNRESRMMMMKSAGGVRMMMSKRGDDSAATVMRRGTKNVAVKTTTKTTTTKMTPVVRTKAAAQAEEVSADSEKEFNAYIVGVNAKIEDALDKSGADAVPGAVA
jgi:hypothetical protein